MCLTGCPGCCPLWEVCRKEPTRRPRAPVLRNLFARLPLTMAWTYISACAQPPRAEARLTRPVGLRLWAVLAGALPLGPRVTALARCRTFGTAFLRGNHPRAGTACRSKRLPAEAPRLAMGAWPLADCTVVQGSLTQTESCALNPEVG